MKLQNAFPRPAHLRLLTLLTTSMLTLGVASAPVRAQVDITKVDWKAVVLADVKLKKPAGELPLNDKYPNILAPNKIQGYAIYDSLTYGDLTGDGTPEAVMPVSSGGTAGDVGALIYRLGRNGKPELVTSIGGYKMNAAIANAELIVTQPQYAGWEPNCCPSAIVTERLRLRGNALRRVSRQVDPLPQARGLTIEHFFSLLIAGDARAAYGFLTPEEQRRNPYAKWRAEFAEIDALALEGVTGSTSDTVVAFVRGKQAGESRRSALEFALVWNSRQRHWTINRVSANQLEVSDAVLAGQLGYPSEGVPPLLIVATDVKSGNRVTRETQAGDGAFALIVPPGTYTVVAYPLDTERGSRDGGGFTAAVGCGLLATCTDHALVPVTIKAGQVDVSVDLTDWYAGETLPPKP
jgi:hypothetical protein